MTDTWARWHGPFETANQAALIFTVCAIVGLWLFRTRQRGAMRFSGIVVFGISLIALAATQSRAGALALIIGVAVLRFWGVLATRATLLIASIAFSVILLWPGGGARILVAMEDAVHGERPILAHSAFALIWDHALLGTGKKFPEIMSMWYLPASLEDRFRSALNDYLTLAGYFGIPLASFLLSSVFTLMVVAWRYSRSPMSALGVAIISIHLTCGIFQAHLWYTLTCFTFLASLFFLAVVCLHQGKTVLTPKNRMLVPATFFISWFILTALTAIVGWVSAVNHPTKTVLIGGEFVARSRYAMSQPGTGVLVCVDASNRSKDFRRRVAHFALLDGWSARVSPAYENTLNSHRVNSVDSRTVVVASRDMGLRVWESIRSNSISGDIIIFDPVDIPTSMPSFIEEKNVPAIRSGRTLIVVRPNAPFVPPDDVLRYAAESDIPHSRVLSLPKGVSDQEAWALMSQFLMRDSERR